MGLMGYLTRLISYAQGALSKKDERYLIGLSLQQSLLGVAPLGRGPTQSSDCFRWKWPTEH